MSVYELTPPLPPLPPPSFLPPGRGRTSPLKGEGEGEAKKRDTRDELGVGAGTLAFCIDPKSVTSRFSAFSVTKFGEKTGPQGQPRRYEKDLSDLARTEIRDEFFE